MRFDLLPYFDLLNLSDLEIIICLGILRKRFIIKSSEQYDVDLQSGVMLLLCRNMGQQTVPGQIA